MKEAIDKLYFIKIKDFSVKGTVKRNRRLAIDWDKMFTIYLSHTGLLFKMHKVFLKFNNRKRNNVI